MVFPYITGKNFAFRILVEIAGALWLGLIALNKEYRLRNSTMVLLILSFTFIVGLADLLGVNPYKSFWSNYERMEGYITILHLALYFMIIKSVLRTKKDWMIFFNIFVLVSIFISLYALIVPPPADKFQRYGQDIFRVYSTIGNPPFLASYLLLAVFLGLILILNTQKTYLKYIYLLSIVLNSIVIYLTATRGAILASLIGVIFFSLFYILGKLNTPKEKLFKKVVLSVLGVLIMLSVVLLTFSDSDFIRQSQTLSWFDTMLSDPAVESRLTVWGMAWEGIKERPILGWGQENFISVYTVNPIPYGRVPSLQWMDRAHNIVLDWLINAGFLGFFSYLAIFGSAFFVIWTAVHKKIIAKTEAITIVAAFFVYFAQNLFTFDTINTYMVFFTLLAYIDNLDYVKGHHIQKSILIQKKLAIKSVGATLIALLIFSVTAYFINYKPLRESQLSRQITISFPTRYSSFLTLLDDFNKALSFKTFGDTDIRLKMGVVSDEILRLKLFTQEGALKFVQATAEELGKLVAANRHNLKYWTYLIKFYNKIAFYEPSFIAKAEALIKECMRLNPEYQWLYFALVDNFIIKKDFENAFVTVKNELAKDPQNDAVQLKLAFTAILTLRQEVLNSALENVKKLRMSKYDDVASGRKPIFSVKELLDLAQASMEIENFSQALQFYKEIIAISTDSTERARFWKAKHHFDMAKIYLKLNDKVNAVKEAKKAADLAPLNYTEDAKKLLIQ